MHLNDEQITEWLLDDAADEVMLHLRRCAACRDEAYELRETIGNCMGRITMDNFGAPLTLLPEYKLNWRSLVTSYGMQAMVMLLLLNVGFLLPDTLKLIGPSLGSPVLLVSTRPPRPAPARPLRELPPPPPAPDAPKIEEPILTASRLPIMKPSTSIRTSTPEETAVPRLQALDVAKMLPLGPEAGKVRVVHPTAVLASPGLESLHKTPSPGDARPTALGDPFGVPGTGLPTAKLRIARLGSPFGTGGPGGEGPGVPGGHGHGPMLAGPVNLDGGRSIPGRGPGGRDKALPGREVIRTSIDQPPAMAVLKPVRQDDKPISTPAKVIAKPDPEYTDEARLLKIEGEVLLQVAFLANGECEVVRVVRGLGHGLDEAAVRAVHQMKFNPATENGQPVDTTTMVRVVFQLAY
jgi:TonB family protein